MIRYVPFLKAKRGELTALSDLNPEVKQAICPFFDFPLKERNYKVEAYAKDARSIATSLKKHWGTHAEFYFDDFDIKLKGSVAGEHQYAYVLTTLSGLQVIPVVGLGRLHHNAAVESLKNNGKIASTTIAFRAERRDFEDFDSTEDEIDYYLSPVFGKFKAIDLILDCRVCTALDVSQTALEIANFAKKFCDTYNNVRRVIVTGSAIPASLGSVVRPTTTKILARPELAILAKARSLTAIELVSGDYATVSPFYSDTDFEPALLPRVTSPRLIYSFNHSHYVSRGSSLASGGYNQYRGLIKQMCGQGFFRHGYSRGEKYFDEKVKGIGGKAMNNTVVRPSVVAHISYMVLDAKI